MIMHIHILLAILAFYSEPSFPTSLVYPPFGHCMGIYRAGTEQLAMLLGGLVRFDDPQGLACVKLVEWDGPGTADDDELAVYGVNSGSGHIIYNADMYTLGLYGGTGSDDDQLRAPHGIAADPAGLVLVADTGNERVAVLQRNGSRIAVEGFLPWDFQQPWDVALDGSGRVAVSDRAANRLLLFDSIADSLPDEVELESPTGIDIVETGERWFHTGDGFAAAVAENGTVLVKLVEGEVVDRVELNDFQGEHLNYPVIDFWGNIWVTDSIACTVHKFNDQLEYLGSFGSRGTDDREFMFPTGITVWRRYGQVFIAEEEGARYFWIGADLLNVRIDVLDPGVRVRGILTEDALVRGTVYGPSGEAVHNLAEGRYPAGDFDVEWDGAFERRGRLPDGEYRLEMVIQPVYSSKGYFKKTIIDDFTLQFPVDQ